MSAIFPPGSEIITGTGVIDLGEEEEFEEDWDLTATSVLRLILEKGSEWTSKTGDPTLVIDKLTTDIHGGRCVFCYAENNPGIMVFISIRGLLKKYNPPSISLAYCGRYGATCGRCNKHFEYQKKSRGFICWACKNGY